MQQPNATTLVEVTEDELPMYCPTPDASLWNSHPRQFIPLQDHPEYRCGYCGTIFRLVDTRQRSPSQQGTGESIAAETGAPPGAFVPNDR